MSNITLILTFIIYLNLFFMRPMGPIPGLLMNLGMLIYWLFTNRSHRVINRWTVLFALTLLLADISLIFYASNALRLIMFWGQTMLLALILYTSSLIPTSLLLLLSASVALIRGYLAAAWDTLRNPRNSISTNETSQVSTQAHSRYLVAFLVSLPVVLLLTALFSSDPVFYHQITRIISEEFLAEIPQRFVNSTLLFALCLPLVHLYRQVKKYETSLATELISRFGSFEIAFTMSTLVTILLYSFIIVQWPYIFVKVAKETELAQYGVKTFSEYVTKGFGELLVASCILLGVIALSVIVRTNISRVSRAYQLVNTFLIGGYTLLLISCMRRVSLYVEYHGLSVVRVYGTVALIALAVIVPFIILRFYRRSTYLFAEAVTICCIYLITVWFPTDSIIANGVKVMIGNKIVFKSAWHPPTVNKRVDHMYLSRLSADGEKGWQKAYLYAKGVLTNKELMDKPILNPKDRHDIAIAGLILRNLDASYQKLADIYMTRGEFFEARLRLIEAYIPLYEKKMQALNLVVKKDDNMLIELNSLKELVPHLKACVDKIKTTHEYACLDTIRVNYDNYSWGYGYPGFNTRPVYARPSYFHEFYKDNGAFDLKHEGGRSGYFAQWRSYIQSEQKAFVSMQKQEYLKGYLKLITQYYALEDKILAQPENERGYEPDISLDTPLL